MRRLSRLLLTLLPIACLALPIHEAAAVSVVDSPSVKKIRRAEAVDLPWQYRTRNPHNITYRPVLVCDKYKRALTVQVSKLRTGKIPPNSGMVIDSNNINLYTWKKNLTQVINHENFESTYPTCWGKVSTFVMMLPLGQSPSLRSRLDTI